MNQNTLPIYCEAAQDGPLVAQTPAAVVPVVADHLPQPEVGLREPLMNRATTWLLARFGQTAFHGMASVTDQIVVSGTNFAASIIVGRVCGPRELGNYTLGFTVYCLALCFQRALISLPFTFYYHHFESDEQREYSGSALMHVGMFGAIVMALLGLASVVLWTGYGSPALTGFALVLAITFPWTFLIEFARRFALSRLEMGTVLIVDIAASAIQIGGLLLLAYFELLTATFAYVSMGVATAVVGVSWLLVARPAFVVRWSRVAADAKRNWIWGRWMLMTQLLQFARLGVLVWLIDFMLGAAWTGIYVASDTLVRLSAPLLIAAANVLYPSAARRYANGSPHDVRRLVNKSLVAMSAMTAPVVLFLVALGDSALLYLYGSEFGGQGLVVALLAIGIIADVFDTGASAGLMAINRASVYCIATLTGTVVILVVAALLIPQWGIVGAAVGSISGRWLASAIQWLAFEKFTKRAAQGGVR